MTLVREIKVDLSAAINAWLEARDRCARIIVKGEQIKPSECMNNLDFATDVLYVAFAEGYTDQSKACADFYIFERLLREQHNQMLPHSLRHYEPTPTVGHA